MLSEHDSSGGGEEEVLPPFLLETTEFVRAPAPEAGRFDSVIDVIQTRRLPYEVFALLGLVGALVLLYFVRPGGETTIDDPLSASQPPSSIVVSERSTTTGDGVFTPNDPGNLSANPNGPSAVQTLPLPSTSTTTTVGTRPPTTATTEAPTTTTTEAPTTTEEPTTTTTEEPTTTTEAGPVIIPLSDCVVETRNNTSVYAAPNGEDRVGRVNRGDYRALAKAGDWYRITDEDATGWIQNNRVRDTEGDCG